MVNKMFFLTLITVFISGCAVTKEYSATGGSRSDGVMKLSYEVGQLEIPHVNEQQGLELARRKCGGWGYSDAESLGGTTRTCNEFGLSQCRTWLITKEYQCLGSLEK